MDLLKTILLYLTMVFVSSVQSAPDPSLMPTTATVTPTATSIAATVTPEPTPTPTPVPTPAPGSLSLLGSFKITFYGPTGHSTKSGTTCTEGRTVAVDPSVIPLGTKIYIDGDPLGGDGYYIAEDTGSAVQGNIIDIFAENGESTSLGNGLSYKIYIVN